MRSVLIKALNTLKIEYDDDMLSKLETYADLLIEKNKVMNLTGITEPAEIATLHFADSAGVLNAIPAEVHSVIDIGTGAGFPGLVLKILRPGLDVTLFDSLEKRLDFLSEVCAAVSVDAITVHGRAEESGRDPEFRDSFDCAVSRAVARLDMLSELCLPFVRPGGYFLAMKSSHSAEEFSNAEKVIASLGGALESVYDYPVGDAVHRIYVIKKKAATPDLYPRRWSKIKKIYSAG